MELAEDELKKLSKVWTLVFASVYYTYIVSGATKPGNLRLLSVLPVIFLFFLLPLTLTSVHFTGTTSFFISWLANSKLLLFAYGRGPLCSFTESESDSNSSSAISLPRFIAIACFPIKLQQNEPNPYQITTNRNTSYFPPLIGYIVKLILMLLVLKIYDFSDKIHPNIIWLIYFLHIYLLLELILSTVAATAKHLLGLELEPQFNNPFLSTSLQDFWGRRWNLMVSSILRPTVYQPILCYLSPRIMNRRTARFPATIAAFAVSGIMHELIFYYKGRLRSDFHVTAFFLLHGFCLCGEILLKTASSSSSKWRIPRVISGLLTVVFVMATAFWLFLPPLLRFEADVRSFREYAAVGAFLRKLRPSFI